MGYRGAHLRRAQIRSARNTKIQNIPGPTCAERRSPEPGPQSKEKGPVTGSPAPRRRSGGVSPNDARSGVAREAAHPAPGARGSRCVIGVTPGSGGGCGNRWPGCGAVGGLACRARGPAPAPGSRRDPRAATTRPTGPPGRRNPAHRADRSALAGDGDALSSPAPRGPCRARSSRRPSGCGWIRSSPTPPCSRGSDRRR